MMHNNNLPPLPADGDDGEVPSNDALFGRKKRKRQRKAITLDDIQAHGFEYAGDLTESLEYKNEEAARRQRGLRRSRPRRTWSRCW